MNLTGINSISEVHVYIFYPKAHIDE